MEARLSVDFQETHPPQRLAGTVSLVNVAAPK